MLERQRDGIAAAKREGKYKGRAPTARRKAPDVMKLAADGTLLDGVSPAGCGPERQEAPALYRQTAGALLITNVAAVADISLFDARRLCSL